MKHASLKQLVYKLLGSHNGFRLLPARPGKHCVLCDERCHSNIALLCEPCLYDLPRSGPSCSICATEMDHDLNNKLGRDKICGNCLKTSPYFDRSFIPFKYSYPINILIKRLKYKDKIIFSKVLAQLFTESLQDRKEDLPECIIPVPLHPIRITKRGFNQSELICREITKNLPCPVNTRICRRIKHTQQQAGMSKKQRTQNIRKAFSISEPVTYKHIAILDDVTTTGSTVNEMARVFKQAGVEEIEIWACAKADLTDP